MQIKNYKKSIETYSKSIKLYKEVNSKEYSEELCNIGLCYLELKDYPNSLRYFKECIKHVEKYNLYEGTKAYCYGGMGEIYFIMKKYKMAKEYFDNAILIDKKINDDYNLAENIRGVGNVFLEEAKLTTGVKVKHKLFDLAISNYKQSINYSHRLHDLNNLTETYKKLSETQKLIGKFKEALQDFEIATKYTDSIFNQTNKETIKNIEDKRTIELRNKEILLNKLTIDAKEKQKWLYLSGLIFLGIIGGLLFYQNQKRRKTNLVLTKLNAELDESNKVKIRFFTILNHDLRNPVSNLIQFLHTQKTTPELMDEETKTRIEAKTITGAEDLLSSMEDILLWSKGQMDNFKPQPKLITVNQLFEDTKKVFSGYQSITFDYQNSGNISLHTDENYLKTIIRNLTSNAINVFKSTQNPIITWKAWHENGQNYLSITDNGSGGTQEQFKALYDDTEVVGIKTGLGLHLIRDLAKAIDCKILVDTKENSGTIFTLILP